MYMFDRVIAVLKEHRQLSDALNARLEEMQRRVLFDSQEINDLLLQINIGRYAGKQLFSKQYADEAEKQQLNTIVESGEDAVRQILDSGWIFILPAIINFVGPERHFDDLWEVGCTALQRALVTYHHFPTCNFQEYVTVWIQQLIEESFQDNSVYVPSLRLLAEYQPKVESKISAHLQRAATVEEVTLMMRYLSVPLREEIQAARRRQTPLSSESAGNLRLAMTKTLLVSKYLEISKEFTMELKVLVDGESYFFDNVVRIEQALAQEIKELYRCGITCHTGHVDAQAATLTWQAPARHTKPWRCRKCRQTQRHEGCGTWQEVVSLHKHPEQICLWLDDGRKFFIEDDFWSIALQLSSGLNRGAFGSY